MAEPTNFNVVDTPILEETNFGPNQDRWMTNLVDIINASFSQITQALANIFAIGKTDVGGGGAGPIVVSVTGVTPTSFVSAQIVSTTNPNISIVSVVPGVNNFSITFSADPGASAIIVYQAFTAQPQ